MSKGGVAIRDLSVVKELIREAIDPTILLEYYGLDVGDSSFKYSKVRCACPLHQGDNPTGFSFDLNTKQFTCFTNHCGEDAHDWWFVPKEGNAVPRDVFLFIKLIEEKKAYENGIKNFKCSFPQAMQIASKLSGIPIDESTSAYNKETMDKLENKKFSRQMAKVGNTVDLEVFDESEIEMFKAQLPMCDYINTRSYSDDILEFFEIGFAPDGIDEKYRAKNKDFNGRIVFPIRSLDGSLVGWSGRLATDDKELMKKHVKWMHKFDFDKGLVLYNFNNARPYVKESKELIIVEGPWDVIRLWSYGIYNTVAVMGSSLTPEQLSLAISSTIKIKVFLDGDGAGKTGAKRICEQLRRYVDVYVVEAEGDDPDDLTADEAWECVTKAKRYIPQAEVEHGTTRKGFKK